jgi:hypothetical protein
MLQQLKGVKSREKIELFRPAVKKQKNYTRAIFVKLFCKCEREQLL